ncbi:MAG: hypothetical protein F6K17_00570 [Okeania sp. SIO3C4]|nr:hypothetical protein [Okeania sp. SIO3C4]
MYKVNGENLVVRASCTLRGVLLMYKVNGENLVVRASCPLRGVVYRVAKCCS